MNDDIVTRLRGLNTASYHLLCNEAADEIESLRRENKLWMGLWEDCVERQKSAENGTVVTDQLLTAGDVMAEWVAVDHSIEQCMDGCEYLIALQEWKEVRRG